MSDASGGTLKQPPMKSKKASTLWAASQQSTSTHQNLSKKMRQSSSKLTCWGSDKKHFFFLVSVEFSALFQYVPWTEVGLFSHFCDGHQSINRDLQWFIFTYRKRIPIYSHYGMDDPSYTMFWQRHICSHQRNAHCQAKAWGSAQGVAPTGGHETAQMG